MSKLRQTTSLYIYLKDISMFLVMTAVLVLNVLAGVFPEIGVLIWFVPIVIGYGLRRKFRNGFIGKYQHQFSTAFASMRMQVVWLSWLLMMDSTSLILWHSSFYVWLAFFMIYFLSGLCLVVAARCSIYGNC